VGKGEGGKRRGTRAFIGGKFNGVGGKAAMPPMDGRYARTGHAFPEAGATKP